MISFINLHLDEKDRIEVKELQGSKTSIIRIESKYTTAVIFIESKQQLRQFKEILERYLNDGINTEEYGIDNGGQNNNKDIDFVDIDFKISNSSGSDFRQSN